MKYSLGKAVPKNDCLSSVLPKPGKHIKVITLNIYMLNNQLNASQCAYKILETTKNPILRKFAKAVMIAQVPPAKYSHTRISEIEIRVVFCSKVVNVLVSFHS